MKRLILVDVPNGWVISEVLIEPIGFPLHNESVVFTEIHLPTDEEIEAKRIEFWNDAVPENTAKRLAKWLKDKILNT